MPARYEITVDGITYYISASGRAKACSQAVREHTGYHGSITVTFARYLTGAVVYIAETAHGSVLEVIVRQ